MHFDLLDQAEALARLDARKPKQANLRRAVSAAYYAAFHFLVHESTCIVMGTQHSQAPFRRVLGRAFVHTVMKMACRAFGGGTLKEVVIKGLPRTPQGLYQIPQSVQDMAAIFAELQEKRHLADYDLTVQFDRSEVLTLIDQVRIEIGKFRAIAADENKKFFLACLWAWKELANR